MFDYPKKEIRWDDSFKVGHQQIDTEHRTLFFIAQKAYSVHTINDVDKQKVLMKEILHELYDYISIHFENEEKLMKEIKYPNLEKHLALHKEMLAGLNHLVVELNSYEISEIIDKLYEFIQEYFLNHIQNEDTKLALWVRK